MNEPSILAAPPVTHVLYVPFVILIGVIIGFIIGRKAGVKQGKAEFLGSNDEDV